VSIKKIYVFLLLVSLLGLAGCPRAQTGVAELTPAATPTPALQTENVPEIHNPGKVIHALVALCDETHEGGWLAWVSPPYQPYAPALAACGIDIARVLVVRSGPAAWVMEQALRSGSCSAVLGWANAIDLSSPRRLQLAAEQAGCLAVLFRRSQESHLPSPAVLRLMLSARPAGLEVRILKSRGARPTGMTLPYGSLQ
jgi:cell division inhibitor SulA/protein ImuA